MPLDYNAPPAANYQDPRDHRADDVQEFLRKIGLIESSGGTNTDHQQISSGSQAGTSAVGTYGLMPNTAQLIDKKSGANELQGMNPDEVSDKLENNPDLTNRLAATMASNLLKNNSQDAASYKWLYGQNSKPTPDQLANSDRVRKFRVLNGQ